MLLRVRSNTRERPVALARKGCQGGVEAGADILRAERVYWCLVVNKVKWDVWFKTFECGKHRVKNVETEAAFRLFAPSSKRVVQEGPKVLYLRGGHALRHICVYNSESMSLPVLPARLQVLHR